LENPKKPTAHCHPSRSSKCIENKAKSNTVYFTRPKSQERRKASRIGAIVYCALRFGIASSPASSLFSVLFVIASKQFRLSLSLLFFRMTRRNKNKNKTAPATTATAGVGKTSSSSSSSSSDLHLAPPSKKQKPDFQSSNAPAPPAPAPPRHDNNRPLPSQKQMAVYLISTIEDLPDRVQRVLRVREKELRHADSK
jgi:hypothetical protein